MSYDFGLSKKQIDIITDLHRRNYMQVHIACVAKCRVSDVKYYLKYVREHNRPDKPKLKDLPPDDAFAELMAGRRFTDAATPAHAGNIRHLPSRETYFPNSAAGLCFGERRKY